MAHNIAHHPFDDLAPFRHAVSVEEVVVVLRVLGEAGAMAAFVVMVAYAAAVLVLIGLGLIA